MDFCGDLREKVAIMGVLRGKVDFGRVLRKKLNFLGEFCTKK